VLINVPIASDSGGSSFDQGVRPVSQSGRPLTGFSRPGSSKPVGNSSDIRSALQSGRRTGTARPMTNLGREVRLGTASLQANGNLVDSSRINVKKYAGKTGVAMAITDYLIYVEHNIRKALELCAEATKAVRVLCKYNLFN
jgi:tetratricopeptide repeat protein 8